MSSSLNLPKTEEEIQDLQRQEAMAKKYLDSLGDYESHRLSLGRKKRSSSNAREANELGFSLRPYLLMRLTICFTLAVMAIMPIKAKTSVFVIGYRKCE